jgi:hypothetical protein
MATKKELPPMKALFKRPPPPAPPPVEEKKKTPAKEVLPEDPSPPWEVGGYDPRPSRGAPAIRVMSANKEWLGTRGCMVKTGKLTKAAVDALSHMHTDNVVDDAVIDALVARFSNAKQLTALSRVAGADLRVRSAGGGEQGLDPDQTILVYANARKSSWVLIAGAYAPPDKLHLHGTGEEMRLASEARDYLVAPIFVDSSVTGKAINAALSEGRYKDAEEAYNKFFFG